MLAEGTLDGRIALVTGGGGGLGRAIALELGRLGAKVAVLGGATCSHVQAEELSPDGWRAVVASSSTGRSTARASSAACDRPRRRQRPDRQHRRERCVDGRLRHRRTAETRERLWPTKEIREQIVGRIPLGRFGTEAEVANACAYLVSHCAAYVTGDVLTVDGGAWLEQGMSR